MNDLTETYKLSIKLLTIYFAFHLNFVIKVAADSFPVLNKNLDNDDNCEVYVSVIVIGCCLNDVTPIPIFDQRYKNLLSHSEKWLILQASSKSLRKIFHFENDCYKKKKNNQFFFFFFTIHDSKKLSQCVFQPWKSNLFLNLNFTTKQYK